MKKTILGLLAIIAVILIAVYLFIPNYINLKNEKRITVSQAGLQRMLLTKSNVLKWWPGSLTDSGTLFYNGNTYTFGNNNVSLIPVLIKGREQNNLSTIFSIASVKESVQLTWTYNTVTSYNPLKRFQYWRNARKLDTDMRLLLDKMEAFYSSVENVYGIKIEKELVQDSILISTAAVCTGNPSNEFIYAQIEKLKKYAATNNALVTGYPMLNVETEDRLHYNVRVALPLNKIIPGNSQIILKRMLGKGNILTATVKGGNTTNAAALRQLNLYVMDYNRIPPAIPFFALITDRSAEPDSSKWITKVYCPVM